MCCQPLTLPEDKEHSAVISKKKGKGIRGIVTAVLCVSGSKVIDQYRSLDQTPVRCLCIITSDHAVKLLLVFYALYELTFVALAHSSEVFVLPQLPVGHAEISTGHAES